jgi:hypothetical protein
MTVLTFGGKSETRRFEEVSLNVRPAASRLFKQLKETPEAANSISVDNFSGFLVPYF